MLVFRKFCARSKSMILMENICNSHFQAIADFAVCRMNSDASTSEDILWKLRTAPKHLSNYFKRNSVSFVYNEGNFELWKLDVSISFHEEISSSHLIMSNKQL